MSSKDNSRFGKGKNKLTQKPIDIEEFVEEDLLQTNTVSDLSTLQTTLNIKAVENDKVLDFYLDKVSVQTEELDKLGISSLLPENLKKVEENPGGELSGLNLKQSQGIFNEEMEDPGSNPSDNPKTKISVVSNVELARQLQELVPEESKAPQEAAGKSKAQAQPNTGGVKKKDTASMRTRSSAVQNPTTAGPSPQVSSPALRSIINMDRSAQGPEGAQEGKDSHLLYTEDKEDKSEFVHLSSLAFRGKDYKEDFDKLVILLDQTNFNEFGSKQMKAYMDIVDKYPRQMVRMVETHLAQKTKVMMKDYILEIRQMHQTVAGLEENMNSTLALLKNIVNYLGDEFRQTARDVKEVMNRKVGKAGTSEFPGLNFNPRNKILTGLQLTDTDDEEWSDEESQNKKWLLSKLSGKAKILKDPRNIAFIEKAISVTAYTAMEIDFTKHYDFFMANLDKMSESEYRVKASSIKKEVREHINKKKIYEGGLKELVTEITNRDHMLIFLTLATMV